MTDITKRIWDRTNPYTRIKLCEFESLEATYEAAFINADFLGFHIFSDQDWFGKAHKFMYRKNKILYRKNKISVNQG
uniref:Uncharacterized protein n=1 Tax=Candidatus Kentrum sp. FW TaxID=2126338 RepID=A0A450TDV1_9GAMM|nr:MAG: hypothetical protein BECKFW1821A_GA0114235_11911 [Candidatus Kentron sp. FW]